MSPPTDIASSVAFGPDGLVPAIVQDAADGRILMLAWMDREALSATLETGDIHFHSRSRDRLWRKGETSGNVLRVRSLALDCDGDAVLVTADPQGPTCHRGTRSCFDAAAEAAMQGTAAPAERRAVAELSEAAAEGGEDFAWLDTLWAMIASRAAERPAGSYTAELLRGGVDSVARKVTEEATEVLLAAKDDATAQSAGRPRDATRSALSGEVADLLYHVLVLLAERELAPREVIAVLRERHEASA